MKYILLDIMKYILFVVLLNMGIQVNCQSFSTVQDKEDKYKERVLKKYSKLSCYDKNKCYSVLFIYHFKFNETPDKSMFNDSLMSNLVVVKEKNNFYSNEAIIYNDSLNVVAYSDNLRVYCSFKPYFYDKLLKYIKEQKVDMLFRISGTNGMIYFGQKEGKILVIREVESKLKISSIDEFINCCWDTLRVTTTN
ncbi:MAG: hypothetical protein ACOX5K_07900 [Bacteroidales bacterium]|jgi:hypothetical protein